MGLADPAGPRSDAAPSTGVKDVPAAEIDKIFARWDKPDSPGVVIAVIHNGQIIYQRGYGMADLEHDVPLSPESVFYIASTSKQFTAASIAILARQGKISLDDDVRKHIAELPDYGTPITIRQLVHHTSGLRDYLSLVAIAGGTTYDFSLDDAVRLIVRQKELSFVPGEEYSYSNSGYALLAEIVQRASGKSLRAFADEHIFRPLDMRHSVFRDDHTMIIKQRAVGHAATAQGFRTDDPGIESVGSGNLWTTVGDLLLWDRNFYDNRLGDGFVDQLLETGKLAGGKPLDYAFGLTIDDYRGLRRVSHGGAFAGFRTEMARFPEARFSVICLANLSSVEPTALAMQVADLYLADRLAPQGAAAEKLAEVTLPDDALALLAGNYRDPRDGTLWTFEPVGGTLKLARFFPWGVKLRALDALKFRGSGPFEALQFEFAASSEGGPRQLRLSLGDSQPRVLAAVALAAPNADELAQYAGSYYSDEVEATYNIVLENGTLRLAGPRAARQNLQPSVRDEFVAPEGALVFERDANNAIAGFRLNTPRVRRLHFVRRSGS
ncbi:MAG: serine hydrolase domain-containing protein [Pirellulales bacterium]